MPSAVTPVAREDYIEEVDSFMHFTVVVRVHYRINALTWQTVKGTENRIRKYHHYHSSLTTTGTPKIIFFSLVLPQIYNPKTNEVTNCFYTGHEFGAIVKTRFGKAVLFSPINFVVSCECESTSSYGAGPGAGLVDSHS